MTRIETASCGNPCVARTIALLVALSGILQAQPPNVSASPSSLTTGQVVVANGTYTVGTSPLLIDGSGNVTGTSNTISSGTLTGGTVTTSYPTTGTPGSKALGLATILISNSGNSSTATAMSELACWDGSGAAKTCLSSATSGVIGIVYATPVVVGASSNYSQIVRMGSFSCKFDGTVTIGHYVVPSGTTAGDCHDTGATTYPSSKQPVGFVASAATGGLAYVSAMDDLPDQMGTFASLGQSNIWTAGTQSFNSAAALIAPVALGAAPTANGSVAYDLTQQRYVFGENTGPLSAITLVPSTSPLGSLGTVPPMENDQVCSLATDSGCLNPSNAITPFPTQFQQTVTIPPGFFSAANRTVRLTYHLSETSSTSGPAVTYYLVWNYNGTPVTIFKGLAATLPSAAITYSQFTINCTVLGTQYANAAAILFANCTSSSIATATVSGYVFPYVFPILAIPGNSVPINSIPPVNTMASEPQSLGLAVSWASATTGNSTTLWGAVPEFVQ